MVGERRESDHLFLDLLKEQGAKLDRIADELHEHTQSEALRMLALVCNDQEVSAPPAPRQRMPHPEPHTSLGG
jgi:hypothetical protein